MSVRVLVVDAAPSVRQRLARALDRHPGIDVCGTAGDAYEARDRIVELAPDVMTLDVDLPRMDGLRFLERLMPQYPMPVVVVGSTTRYGARTSQRSLDAGAVGFVPKPPGLEGEAFDGMIAELCRRIVQAPRVRPRVAGVRPGPARRFMPGGPPVRTTGNLIAIGASTGGVEALRQVLTSLPAVVPCIVVVQHMPPSFTGPLARRLDQLCAFSVAEARHGDRLRPGRCLLAPGDRHLQLVKDDGMICVALSSGPKVDGHRPSATVMMRSVARAMGRNASGAILTGMGRDGAEGLLAMRRAGAHTVVQDEETSVVYGMPRAAFELGAARYQLPLSHIGNALLTPFRT